MARAAPEYPETPPAQRAAGGDAPVVETATEARQGVTGHNVRYVLLFGTGAVIVAFAVIYGVFFAG